MIALIRNENETARLLFRTGERTECVSAIYDFSLNVTVTVKMTPRGRPLMIIGS